MLKELVKNRNLPPFKSREEMVEILLKEEYGILPNVEYEVKVSDPIPNRKNPSPIVKSSQSKVEFTISSKYGSHSFFVERTLQTDGEKHPLFIFVNFHEEVPNIYYPLEEVTERGFNVLSFYYKAVTSDDGDFTNGISKVLLPNGQENGDTAGKIMLWAFTAMRVLDYAETLAEVDLENVGVLGHSRLGKTALVTAMLDKRFKYAFSNNSGCSGASLSRGNSGLLVYGSQRNCTEPRIVGYGETIADVFYKFPYWFCKNYYKSTKNNYPDDFDQHYLLSSIAPRFAYVGSGSKDLWADPKSEFLNCVASSEIYEKLGLKGLISEDKFPEINERFIDGRIGYHLREGVHYLSRHDWNNYMDFIDLHKNEKV